MTTYTVKSINIGTKMVRDYVPNDKPQIVCGFKVLRFIDENTGEIKDDIYIVLSGGGVWPSNVLEVVDSTSC